MKFVEVVAGIIFDSCRSQVLLALRKPEQHQGDRWEFPGGKLEDGETPSVGLNRELREELGIDITRSVHRQTLEHCYPDKQVRLYFRDVTAFAGHPQGLEGQTLKWVSLGDLDSLQFPEANQPIVEDLMRLAQSGIV